MKPKRTLEEATELFKKGNKDPKIMNFFDELCGSTVESAKRTGSLELMSRSAEILGITDPYQAAVLFSLICTAVDTGTVIGRLLYEDLPSEVKTNAYLN